MLRKKAWSKLTPLRSLRFLIFDNNIPSFCCELGGEGEGKGGSCMTVSEWLCSWAVAGTPQSCCLHAPLPCTRHSCPAPTDPTFERFWGGLRPGHGAAGEGDAALAAGEYEPLWLSLSWHVGFGSWSCYHIAALAAVTLPLAQRVMQWQCSPSQADAGWKALPCAGYKLYSTVHTPAERASLDTFCSCNGAVVAGFGVGKLVINRIYCWFISTVCTNSRSQSELQLICLWFILSSWINWRWTTRYVKMLPGKWHKGISYLPEREHI